MVFCKQLLSLLAAALVARPAAAAVAGNLFLYTNTPGPNEASVPADFSEPTYAGYARQAVAVTGPFSTGGGGPFVVHITDSVWSMGDSLLPTTIHGAGVIDGAGNVLFAADFDEPYHLVTSTDALILGGNLTVDDDGLSGTWDVES